MAKRHRYSIRKLNELTDPTKPRGLALTTGLLLARLQANSSPPDRLAYGEGIGRKWPSHFQAVQRIRLLMRQPNGPKRIVIRTHRGADYAIRKFAVPEAKPVLEGPGTDQIDRIRGAVYAFCKQRGWHITELGICANKPGEHGHCNAWDAGVIYEGGRLLPADEIHRRNSVVADFLQDEGIKNQNGNGGLPVNGVIVMSKYWERGMGNDWRYYSGTPHVTHWHVSGHPSRTGWV